MIRLEKNDDGRVTGLIATDKDGNYVRYNAKKGVIIATGGYYNGSYPNLLAGTQAGRIATFGRLAGQLAAEGK